MRESILLTGGFGFIGSNLVKYLLRASATVSIVNVDKKGEGSDYRNLEGLGPRLTSVVADLRDAPKVRRLAKEATTVVHLAAESHVDRSIKDPEEFAKNNVISTLTLMEALRRYNDATKIVHISTDEVYGDRLRGSFKETDRLKPSNPYSGSKAAAEMIVTSYKRTYGMDVTILRCTNNFGPFQSPEKLIPKTIICALLGFKIPLYGRGTNVRDWLFVEDFCEAIATVMKKRMRHDVYNVSANNEVRNIDLVKEILNIMGRDEGLVKYVHDRPGHDLRYSLHSELLRRETGWKPKHSFSKALRLTVGWYSSNRWWWEKKTGYLGTGANW